jgi:hypothetical protein
VGHRPPAFPVGFVEVPFFINTAFTGLFLFATLRQEATDSRRVSIVDLVPGVAVR